MRTHTEAPDANHPSCRHALRGVVFDEAGNQGCSRSAHGMTQRGSFRGLNGIVRLSVQPGPGNAGPSRVRRDGDPVGA